MITASITMLQFWGIALFVLVALFGLYSLYEYTFNLRQLYFPVDENKYRIREVVLKNGSMYWEVEYKIGFFWRSYRHTLFDCVYSRLMWVEQFGSRAEACDKIHELIDKEKSRRGRKKDHVNYYYHLHKKSDTQ